MSDKATTCPACGAPKPKGTSRLTIFFGGLLVLAFVAAAFKTPDSASSKSEASPPPTAPQAEAKAREERLEEAQFSMAFDAAKAVKGAMRDPDSLKWEYIGVTGDAQVACLKYRAKNGFGGMNSEFAVVADNKATSKAADWKKHCTGPLRDLTAAGS